MGNEPLEYEIRDWINFALYLITSMIAVTGNVFICVTIYRKGRINSTTYLLIFNMAISDIIGGTVIPAQWLFCSTAVLDSGTLGQAMCGLMKTLQILSYYVSSLSMAAIAYDRYKLVCKPTSSRTSARVLVTLVWVQGCIFISSNFLSLRVTEYFSPTKGFITCRVIFPANVGFTFRKIRATVLIITQYIIPLSFTAICYTFVMRRVWSREQLAGKNSNEKQKKFKSKKKQTIIMLIVVTILFAISFLPTHVYFILMFYTKVIPVRKGTCYSSLLFMLAYWFGISSCAYNPFIYCYFNADFRHEALRYWRLISFNCSGSSEMSESGVDQSGLGVSTTSSEMGTNTTTASINQSASQKVDSTTTVTVSAVTGRKNSAPIESNQQLTTAI